MSLIFQLSGILSEAKRQFEQLKASGYNGTFFVCEQMFDGIWEPDTGRNRDKPCCGGKNLMARGDNLEFICYLLREREMAGKVQLIYLDPPFCSGSGYDAVVKLQSETVKGLPSFKVQAYDDSWKEGMDAYLFMLAVRFFLMRELLSEEGCIWVHLDWHASHYVKLLLDEIFGEKQFINEIIWTYKSGGSSKRSFARKHDTLLFYSKSNRYYFQPVQEKSYNRGYKPYRFKGVKEFQDEIGWYTMVNMKDVWQIDMVGRTSSERTGYATQKPEQLLSRIIESCSRAEDICADFFAGSATLAAVAEKKNRRWISCDGGTLAVAAGIRRLARQNSSFQVLKPEKAVDECDEPQNHTEHLNVKYFTQNGRNVIKLVSYDKDVGQLPVKEKERELIFEAIRQEPLCLLDYWSVDFQYDGKKHCPAFFSENPKETVIVPQWVADGNRIGIRAVDRFGNQIEKVIEERKREK